MNSLNLRALAPVLVLLILSLPGVAQNQHELNAQAKANYDKVDAELNDVWRTLTGVMDKPQREKLVTSQLHWIKYRDAEAEARAHLYDGGSMQQMIYWGSMTETTRKRIEILRHWMEEFSH